MILIVKEYILSPVTSLRYMIMEPLQLLLSLSLAWCLNHVPNTP